MSESQVFWPPDDYDVLAFEDTPDATIVELEIAPGGVYRLTAPITPTGNYAELATWTLERHDDGWQPVDFVTPDEPGRDVDFLRTWANEFQQLRSAQAHEDDEEGA